MAAKDKHQPARWSITCIDMRHPTCREIKADKLDIIFKVYPLLMMHALLFVEYDHGLNNQSQQVETIFFPTICMT